MKQTKTTTTNITTQKHKTNTNKQTSQTKHKTSYAEQKQNAQTEQIK